MDVRKMPALFSNAIRYGEGDEVKTPYGAGIVRMSNRKYDTVQVHLYDMNAELYTSRSDLMPALRMLKSGELPKGTSVLYPHPTFDHTGTVQTFLVRENKYRIIGDQDEALTFTKTELRLATGTRVRTPYSLATVQTYQPAQDTYILSLDIHATGYFTTSDVTPLDLRVLSLLPSPVTPEKLQQEFQGNLSLEDAQVLSNRAERTYLLLRNFCEQHAETLSLISMNASYGDQYARAIMSLLDPSLTASSNRLRAAGQSELLKLRSMAANAKETLETQLLGGKETSAFLAQTARVLQQVSASDEAQELGSSLKSSASTELDAFLHRQLESGGQVLEQSTESVDGGNLENQRVAVSQVLEALESQYQRVQSSSVVEQMPKDPEAFKQRLLLQLQQHDKQIQHAQQVIAQVERAASTHLGVTSLSQLDPNALMKKAEDLLPIATAAADAWRVSGQQYWSRLQQSTQGRRLVSRAQKWLQAVDEEPDQLYAHMTKALADVRVDKLAAWGAELSNDRMKRQAVLDQVKDRCLDFFTSVLPAIHVDTINGVEENVEYAVSELDLSSFRVRKDRVKVRMGRSVQDELLRVRATQLTAMLKGFKWTFSQKHFPFLNGGGVANAELSGGLITLGFKAERTLKDGSWKPTLALHSLEIAIQDELKLSIQGSWFSSVYNLLASVFAELIREYLARSMEKRLLRHMMRLLGQLNTQMDKYWPLMFQLMHINVMDLPEASAWRGAEPCELDPTLATDITFNNKDDVPFAFAKGVFNNYVVVSHVLEDAYALSDQLAAIPMGASVLAINGLSCAKLTLEELQMILKNQLQAPFSIRFTLAPEDPVANRQAKAPPRPRYVTATFKQEGAFGLRLRRRPAAPFGAVVLGFSQLRDGRKNPAEALGVIEPGMLVVGLNDVDLRFKTLPEILLEMKHTTQRPAHLKLVASPDSVLKMRSWPPMVSLDSVDVDCYGSDDESDEEENKEMTLHPLVTIAGFTRLPSFAQQSGKVEVGDVLFKLNDEPMTAPTYHSFNEIMTVLQSVANTKEPMAAVFISKDEYNQWKQRQENGEKERNDQGPTSSRPTNPIVSEKRLLFPRPPLGIWFGNLEDEAVYIRQFKSSPGPAEKSKAIVAGRHAVLQVDGTAVGEDATVESVQQLIDEIDTNIVDKNGKKKTYSMTVRDIALEKQILKRSSRVVGKK